MNYLARFLHLTFSYASLLLDYGLLKEESSWFFLLMASSVELAEQNAALILHIFHDLLHACSEVIGEGNSFGQDCRGLYMFYVRRKSDEKKFPVYVGSTTGKSFHSHFMCHPVIATFFDANAPFPAVNRPDYDMFAYQYSCTPVSAKLLETIFLLAFDFAQNGEENGGICPDLDFSRENAICDSIAIFRESYRSIICGIKGIRGSLGRSLHSVLNHEGLLGEKRSPSGKPSTCKGNRKTGKVKLLGNNTELEITVSFKVNVKKARL